MILKKDVISQFFVVHQAHVHWHVEQWSGHHQRCWRTCLNFYPLASLFCLSGLHFLCFQSLGHQDWMLLQSCNTLQVLLKWLTPEYGLHKRFHMSSLADTIKVAKQSWPLQRFLQCQMKRCKLVKSPQLIRKKELTWLKSPQDLAQIREKKLAAQASLF